MPFAKAIGVVVAWNGPNGNHPPADSTPKDCDFCHQEKELRAVLGESDTWGAEWHHLCDTCANKVREGKNKLPCAYCRKADPEGLVAFRDPDEGMGAATRNICHACYGKAMAEIQAELDRYDGYGGYDDFGDDDYGDYQDPWPGSSLQRYG